jgi:hypothetical protein
MSDLVNMIHPMATADSMPLELIYDKFLRVLEKGDAECALDLMAVAALTVASTPSQTERHRSRQLARLGIVSAECADFRRDEDFDEAALRFAVNSAVPLASALPGDVGASLARRCGWIWAWSEFLRIQPDDLPQRESLDRYNQVISDLAGFFSLGEAQNSYNFVRLAHEVEQSFPEYKLSFKPASLGAFKSTYAALTENAEEDCSFENETLLCNEFESFLDNDEGTQALNLLAVASFRDEYSDDDVEDISEVLRRSEVLIREVWDDSTESDELLSQLWVTAYSKCLEMAKDKGLPQLALPAFEPPLLPLSAAQQQLLETSIRAYEAKKSGHSPNPKKCAAEQVTEEEEQASELIDGALRYFDEVDLHFYGDRVMVPATLIRGAGDEQSQWVGFIMAKDGMIGFFEESDCLVEEVDDGDPVLYFLSDLQGCTVRLPKSIHTPPGLLHIRFAEPRSDFIARLQFGSDSRILQFGVRFADAEETQKEDVAGDIQQLLALFEKALSLQGSAEATGHRAVATQAPPDTPASRPQPVPATEPASKSAVEFRPYLHSTDRYPAAPGFIEQQLDDVPLITVHPAAVPAAIGAAFMLLAAMGAQYEFYVVVRWAVTAMAIWMSVVASSLKRTPWVVLFTGIAILFNPLIPVYATREFWAPIDYAGFVLFWVAGVKLRASKPAPPSL